ncbi:polysaccharide biosynthesis protein [Methanofollis aquaemaris]|uniref:Polysaccharide biosynthesis protein n=1 Tax=Methanofollis aquaemaris TaxID=126734 RepID=A0A8A3S6U6_9EURY|nr:N-acetylneuraminate synthase family protein [Methanofollis aquaemaris]QSZ67865.1 polysaccharide biosynthesis protein [Methanofollis aquaemaris]
METIDIDGKIVGKGKVPYFIAEIGSNHNGDMDLCKKMIDAAIACGADAVKFQSWTKSSLISKAEYARNTEYSDKKKHFGSLEAMVEKYQFTTDQHKEIISYCKSAGITFLSSCFSNSEVDLLVSLDVPVFKIASMDINNLPFLEYVASKGRPVILSTGMASLGEIETAIATLRSSGSGSIALLHCVSIYPPNFETINLRNISTLEMAFDMPVGFSDHTLGTAIPTAAIALGACIIEKHFTLDKNLLGWDHAISADPVEMKRIVQDGKEVFLSLGNTLRSVSDAELEKRKKFRRSVVLKRNMKKGEIIDRNDIDFKRPGTGIGPEEIKYLIDRSLSEDVEADVELKWSDIN